MGQLLPEGNHVKEIDFINKKRIILNVKSLDQRSLFKTLSKFFFKRIMEYMFWQSISIIRNYSNCWFITNGFTKNYKRIIQITNKYNRSWRW